MTRGPGVVFDLDDTLYLECDYVRSGFRAVAELARVIVGIDGLYDDLVRVFAAGERTDVIGAALRVRGAPDGREALAELVSCYREHEPVIKLLPRACDALGWAAERGPVGVITDGDPTRQERKVQALGVRAWADPVVLSGRWGKEGWKPALRAFQLIELDWEDRVEGLVYVADNPVKDFVAPRALGWTTVRVRHPEGQYAALDPTDDVDLEVSDIGDVPYLLGERLARGER